MQVFFFKLFHFICIYFTLRVQIAAKGKRLTSELAPTYFCTEQSHFLFSKQRKLLSHLIIIGVMQSSLSENNNSATIILV